VNVQCPTCGAAVEFRYDDSFVRVCDHCRAAVVRGDRGVETLGQIADLTPTASPLKLFSDGRYKGEGFMLVGRAQYKHPAGGIWDEWYAKMDDGRWGWLAEAQGRFYLTFETLGAGDPPRWDEVFPGATVQLEDDGLKLFTVGERGEAELVAAAGEIPFRFTQGAVSAFADLADGTGRFATIDYGEPSDDAADNSATIYIGRQVSLGDLGISGGESAMPARAIAAAGPLACPNCGAPVEIRAPDRSLRVVCGHCSSLLDCEGPLAVIETLAQVPKQTGTIPLGARGTFDGVTYTLIGRLQREASYPGGHVFLWDEHLLYEPSVGFRWLVEANGHWSFVTTVPPGAVQIDYHDTPEYEGTKFRLFDRTTVEVTEVWGELYWRVRAGERVDAADYVAPPAMLSRETTADEINWSLGVYKTHDEIEQAFGVKSLPGKTGVAPNQPFKHRHITRVLGILAAAFLGVTCTRMMTADERIVLDATLALEAPPAEAIPPELQGSTTVPMIVFTEPFTLAGHENVEVKLRVDVKDSWAFVTADLVNEATGEVESFEKEVAYYSGTEGGEYWSEGSPATTHMLPAVAAGSYILRLEVQQPMFGMRDTVDVRIRQDVFRWRHALYALLVFAIPGLLLALWKWSFERKRWSESDHAPTGLGSGGDD
jgi:hypothetical protein